MKPLLFIAAIVIAIILLIRYGRKAPAPTRYESQIANVVGNGPAPDTIHENALNNITLSNFTLGGGLQGYSPRPTL